MNARNISLILFIMAGPLAISCATTPVVLRKSPDFDRPSIISGGILIGGYSGPNIKVADVVNAVFKKDDKGNQRHEEDLYDVERSAKISALVRDAILGQRPQYPVIGADMLLAKLGRQEYQKFLLEFFKAGEPGQKWLGEIREKSPGVRFLLMAREEENRIAQKIHSGAPRKKPGANSSAGQREGHTKISYENVRTITTVLTIYDLQAGSEIWAGKVKRTKIFPGKAQADLGPSSIGIEYKSGNLLAPTPDEESILLKEIFGIFGENLP